MALELDIAIVGAGVSGVYSAWKLKQKHPNLNISVFEASDRIGGRLLSVTPPGIPNMVAELGGMRILPAVQPRIAALLETLNNGAGPEERIDTFDFPVDQPQNLAYLRGTYLRLSDFTQHPEKVPYKLAFLEAGNSAGTLVINAIEQIVPGITAPGLTEEQRREMTRDADFAGEKLYKQGFWQVLVRVMSGEAYQLALDAGGYQSTLNNWNAADAVPWFLSDFGVDAKYKGFKKGFQQVPLTIARHFEALGGSIQLNHPVSHFMVEPDMRVRLTFKDNPEEVLARVVILAMPRRALDLIREGTPFLRRPDVTELLHTVTPQPLFKLFATYRDPWWLPAGVQAGRTTTDLPVRQTYYWPKNDGTPATQGPSMLMASYDDGTNIGFWDGFRDKRGLGWLAEARNVPRKERFVGLKQRLGREGEVDGEWLKHAAPAAMVAEVQRQLRLVHGLGFVPDVLEAAYRDWGQDPYGGGWNSWNIGVSSHDVIQRVPQPVADTPVYICGEAYSGSQGWVEGALETADLVLAKLETLPLLNPKNVR